MTTTQASAIIVRSWKATRTVFRRGRTNSKGINEWINLVTIVSHGPGGVLLKELTGKLNRQRFRRQLTDWEKAGLIVIWHDRHTRNPRNNRPLQRLRATPKLHKFLRLGTSS